MAEIEPPTCYDLQKERSGPHFWRCPARTNTWFEIKSAYSEDFVYHEDIGSKCATQTPQRTYIPHVTFHRRIQKSLHSAKATISSNFRLIGLSHPENCAIEIKYSTARQPG
jgi:hypothetical protein